MTAPFAFTFDFSQPVYRCENGIEKFFAYHPYDRDFKAVVEFERERIADPVTGLIPARIRLVHRRHTVYSMIVWYTSDEEIKLAVEEIAYNAGWSWYH